MFSMWPSSPGLIAQVTSTEVEESLRWLRLPPMWLVVLVIIPLVIGFVTFFYRREILVGKSSWRWPLAVLRTLLILAVLGMMAQPVRRKTTYETRDSTLLVLVDESLSMDISDRYSVRDIPQKLSEFFNTSLESVESTSRYDLVRKLFTDEDIEFVRKLRSKGKVVVATFARSVQERAELSRLREGEVDETNDQDPSDLLPSYSQVRGDSRVQETRIGDGLRDAVSSVVGAGFSDEQEKISGLLLITDGQENAGSASALDLARRFGERGTPVHVIGVGNPDEPKDIRLVHLDVSEVVLVDDLVSFDVTVIADGFEGERVPVRLNIDSRLEDSRYITIEGGGQKQIFRLEYRPRKPGEITVTVEIEKLGGEVFYDNNSISKTIRVLDEKIRVLYLESLPRWEYRYLKNALIRDQTMETQCWLYSADPEFVQESSKSLPTLVSPPRERSELFKYHVIVLGDVDPGDLGPQLIEQIKEFVYEGGGIVFLSGRNANPSRYLHSDLYAILPVEVPEADLLEAPKPVIDSFKVRLTPEGGELPVMRLDNDAERNKFLWEGSGDPFSGGLAPFYWYAKAGKEKAGTVVLARHDSDEIVSTRRPRVIFAYMNYGRGRSFFSAVDNTWRWRAGVENLHFYRFWGQVTRFVATGRLRGNTPQYSVATDKNVYNIGEIVKIDSRVFDADMKPSTEKTVTLYHQVQGRDGEPPDQLELSLNEVKGQGSYEGAMTATVRGRHDVWLGSETERLAFRSFTVEIPALETRDPKLNRPFLQKIAKASGGQYHELYGAATAVEMLQGVTRSQEGLVEGDDLWDEWWVLVMFTILICGEWIVR